MKFIKPGSKEVLLFCNNYNLFHFQIARRSWTVCRKTGLESLTTGLNLSEENKILKACTLQTFRIAMCQDLCISQLQTGAPVSIHTEPHGPCKSIEHHETQAAFPCFGPTG